MHNPHPEKLIPQILKAMGEILLLETAMLIDQIMTTKVPQTRLNPQTGAIETLEPMEIHRTNLTKRVVNRYLIVHLPEETRIK